MSLAIPALPIFDHGDQPWRDTVLPRYGSLRHGAGFNQNTNTIYVVLCELGIAGYLSCFVHMLVCEGWQVFKIVVAIVQPVFVSMMNLVISRTLANEGKGNQFMDVELSPLVVLEKPEVVITVLQAKHLVFGVVALCMAVLGSNALCNALNLPKIANDVKTLVAGDIVPFFGWEKGNLRGMLSHVDKLLSAFGHAWDGYSRRQALSFPGIIIPQMGHWPTFGAGWTRRVSELMDAAA